MYRMPLLIRLVAIKTREDMLNEIGSSKVVEVYMVFPTQKFALPCDSSNVKWKSNVVIEEIMESETNFQPESQPIRGDDPSVNIHTEDDTCYILQQREQAWDNVD
ncbi:hypothetical protein Fot_24963 [Forsythia ovata]|uniref:Uncharacterized protein n=1 Tax=Forsythia ovata TaxID=205694 RepID=A0ABD1U7P7_9LAMI